MSEIAVREPQSTALSNEQLKYIAGTEFVPKALRNNIPAIMACVATGRAIGIDDMSSLRLIHVVNGRPTFSAELMVQIVRRHGHSLSGVTKDGSCTVVGTRADNGDTMEVTWTLEMAQRAGLASKEVWKAYPEALLWARAVSQLCRQLFADCFAGATYTPDEIADGDFEDSSSEGAVTDSSARGHARPVDGRGLDAQQPGGRAPTPAATDGTGEQEPRPAPDAEDSVGEPQTEETPTPVSTVSDAPPAGRPSPTDAPSEPQIRKLNVLVGTLRDAGTITTADVYAAVGRDPVAAVSKDGELHWSPLRDSLTREEASFLIDLLDKIEADTAGLTFAQFRANVKAHGVSAEARAAAMHRLYPGVEKSSDLTDEQRGRVWAEIQRG